MKRGMVFADLVLVRNTTLNDPGYEHPTYRTAERLWIRQAAVMQYLQAKEDRIRLRTVGFPTEPPAAVFKNYRLLLDNSFR
jgi:hypothetical protein